MIITVNKVFAGSLDLSALERVEDQGIEKIPFHLVVWPGQVITVDDRYYDLINIQSSLKAGYITITDYNPNPGGNATWGLINGNILLQNDLQLSLNSKADSSNVHSVPSGGNVNQVLTKNSDSDYDLKWSNVSSEGSTDKFKISSSDTTSDYAESKITAGSGITIEKLNIGGNETLSIKLYVSPIVSLSGGSTNEKGSTINNVALSWTTNKTMTSRILSSPVPIEDRDLGAGGNGNYTHNGANLTTNTTYSITVNDGTNSSLSSTSVSFINRRYYGVNILDVIDNSNILLLSNEFASSRSNTHSYDCSGGKYIWICYPASLGAAIFKIGGIETTFTLFIQSVTNGSLFTESFNCYRSTELQNGSDISVVVT